MAWGARQHEDGTWRLCERKGRTILRLSPSFPDMEIRFASQAKTKKCADQLNELYWATYEKARKKGEATPPFAWSMAHIIHDMGGISDADWKRITT
ncbi:MAG: hypothetical protein EOQ56_28140 [Mesorhizobium sp.]|nr:MAG: hypothetical protein EOQ56_28140 [Mesorhizobium sp.]